MPHSDRRHPDPPVSFHILLALRLIGDHLRATQDVRPGNSIADRVPGLPSSRPSLLGAKTHLGEVGREARQEAPAAPD